jgi:hypothetical protein
MMEAALSLAGIQNKTHVRALHPRFAQAPSIYG